MKAVIGVVGGDVFLGDADESIEGVIGVVGVVFSCLAVGEVAVLVIFKGVVFLGEGLIEVVEVVGCVVFLSAVVEGVILVGVVFESVF
ncbi:MAG: hypothetical protein Tsb0021_04930 [Chlamydiales bacterium]